MLEQNLRSAAAIFSVAIASGSIAAPALANEAGEAAPDAAIVVTGTLIRGSVEDAPAPVDVIRADELVMQGSPSAIELLKNLPTASGIIGEANQFEGRSQSQEGTASVNLRGLGPQRTLVLLNGHRMVQGGSNNLPYVDVNMFPAAALERIDVLKDGAAATYGSDAIAGVVNFITRTGQEGFVFNADYRFVDGSEGNFGASLSYGHDYGDISFLISGGYQQVSSLANSERDWAIRPYEENPQGGWTGAGNPGNYDFNSTVGGLSFTADQGCEALGGFRSLEGSTTDRCFGQYTGFGNLVEPQRRYQFFTDIAWDVSDSASLRFSALYGHSESQLTSTPSYLSTQAPSANAAYGGQGLFVIPNYAPGLIDYCSRYGTSAGCNMGEGSMPQSSALAYPLLFRPALAGGNPLYTDRVTNGANVQDRWADAWQLTASFDAELSPSIDFNAGLTYSSHDRTFENVDSFGDLLQNALAGFAGDNCAYASPSARAGLIAGATAGLTPGSDAYLSAANSALASVAGRNGCSFWNPFSNGVEANVVTGQVNPDYAGNGTLSTLDLTPGAGLINSADTFAYFWREFRTRAKTQQVVADAAISGLTGLELGGGEVGFAFGGQYRKDFYNRYYGPYNNLDLYPCPGTPLNPDATCNPQTGSLGFIGTNRNQSVVGDVWALYSEVQLPVTERLQAQISARYENYGGTVGSTFDPQLRVKWEATDWLAFRGGLGTTFRGPPPQNLSSDITTLQLIGGNFRAVDLLGNGTLTPESATTYSGGVLVNTSGFKASVDYFRYDISGPIEEEPVAGIVAAMFGSTGSANCGNPDYAALEARFTFAGSCNVANVARLKTTMFNSADVTTSGLDIQASYSFDLNNSRWEIGAAGTYVLEYKIGDVYVEGILVQPEFDAVGKLNYQTTAFPLPPLKGQLWLQGERGDQAMRLQLNYIDGYTDQRGASVYGPNWGALAGASVTEGKNIGSFVTVDMTYRLTLPETRTRLTLSLLNILDQAPPFVRLDLNYDPMTASALGFTAKGTISQEF